MLSYRSDSWLMGQDLESPRSWCFGKVNIDFEFMRVTCGRRTIRITPREWAVLRVLVSHVGRIVSSRQLLREAWGPEYGDENDYVRTYIRRLRAKLEPDTSNPRYIVSERGLGYRLVDPS